MRRATYIFLLVISLVPYGQAEENHGKEALFFQSEGIDLSLEILQETDSVVWAMDFIGPDTMIFTERKGQINLLDLDTNEVSPIAGGPAVHRVVGGGPFDQVASGGLFDILVDPDFETNRFIYLTYVKKIGDGHALAAAKGQLQDHELINLEDIFVANNASSEAGRWGSRIAMDRDRYLYIAVGDRRVGDNAQDLQNHCGKIVRLNDDGSIPADNPFVGRTDAAPEIWSYGHRNPQGLAFHADSGVLFEHEHGPAGGDEINIIEQGKNYGWPVVTYGVSRTGDPVGVGTAQAGMEQPIKFYKPGIAPSGMTFYFGNRYPEWRGDLFNGALAGQHLNRLVLDQNTVIREERLLDLWGERIRDVAEGPDGFLYLSTESGKIARILPLQ